MMTARIAIEPPDQYNQLLVSNARPDGYINPQPDGRYNLVVIGAGPAGLVAAAATASLGGKVALVEKHLMGGDCLNVGCVPSKALLRSARAYAHVREASSFGVDVPEGVRVNFSRVMERMRKLRAGISKHDAVSHFRELGIEVFLGAGQFTGRDSFEIDGKILRFAKACIATGARAAAPPIQGLNDVKYLTNESLFTLTELPRRLGVIGAGPVGCEMAQAFARFGSEVHLIEEIHGVLPREDSDASEIIRKSLLSDGVKVMCCGKALALRKSPGGIRMKFSSHGQDFDVEVDQLLVSVGRAPNVENLGLEAANVKFDRSGVVVDDFLRTSNHDIFAAGDVCSKYKFTHAADAMARIVVRNAFFFGRARASKLIIPWATYTQPELAQVGLNLQTAKKDNVKVDVVSVDLSDVDRAVLDGEEEGFGRLLLKAGTDTILGATLVSSHAGDMIGEVALAMTHNLGAAKLSTTIHPYPTQGEIWRKLGDTYNRTRLTSRSKGLLTRILAWRRG